MACRPEADGSSEPERQSGSSDTPEASKPDETADDSVPSSELDSQWQLAGDSDHEQDSGYSDLGSELDRASSPDPTLDALRFTSRQHGLAASSHLPADLAQVQALQDASTRCCYHVGRRWQCVPCRVQLLRVRAVHTA